MYAEYDCINEPFNPANVRFEIDYTINTPPVAMNAALENILRASIDTIGQYIIQNANELNPLAAAAAAAAAPPGAPPAPPVPDRADRLFLIERLRDVCQDINYDRTNPFPAGVLSATPGDLIRYRRNIGTKAGLLYGNPPGSRSGILHDSGIGAATNWTLDEPVIPP
jgi:hypothetical protein